MALLLEQRGEQGHAARSEQRVAVGRPLHHQVRQSAARMLHALCVPAVLQHLQQQRDGAGLTDGVAVSATRREHTDRGSRVTRWTTPGAQQAYEQPCARRRESTTVKSWIH